MVYLFVGINEIYKEQRIQEFKKEVVKKSQEIFDYERLYSKELTPALLKESLNRIPVVSKKRLVFVRDIDKLNEKCKQTILSYISKPNNKLLLILDTQITQLKNSFLRKIANSAKVIHCGREEKIDTFVLANAIKKGRSTEALKIFSTLSKKGEHPIRILGGLVWSWKDMRGFLKGGVFKKGIELFLETDTNIKFSRLNPETAMEMLIVRLCFLTGG